METIETVRTKVPKNLLVAAARIAKEADPAGRYGLHMASVSRTEVVGCTGNVALAFPLPEPIELDGPAFFDGQALWDSRAEKAITRFEVPGPHDPRLKPFPSLADVIPARDAAPAVSFNIKLLTMMLESLARAGASAITLQPTIGANGDAFKRAWRVEGYGGNRYPCGPMIGYGAIMPVSLVDPHRPNVYPS